MLGLISIAFFLSFILSLHYLNGGNLAGCSGQQGCDQVINSRWSMVLDFIPVSGLALGVYLTMFVACFFIGPATEASIRVMAWGTMLVLAGSVSGSAVWFIVIQKWFIGEFCLYCMTTHTIGLILSGLIFWKVINNSRLQHLPRSGNKPAKNVLNDPSKHIIQPLQAIGITLLGAMLAGILATCQIKYISDGVHSIDKPKENWIGTDNHNIPMIGSPDAPYIIKLLFDYQCSHCQKIHFMLNDVIGQYKGKLAFAMCPVPLDAQCNAYIPQNIVTFKNSCELARIGLTVWLAKPEAFYTFENWMFTFESGNNWHPRSIEAAREKAIELVGHSSFDKCWSDPWIENYLQDCIRIFGQTIIGGSGIPKMIFGSKWVIPEPYNANNLVEILQVKLNVPEP